MLAMPITLDAGRDRIGGGASEERSRRGINIPCFPLSKPFVDLAMGLRYAPVRAGSRSGKVLPTIRFGLIHQRQDTTDDPCSPRMNWRGEYS